jgi:hypothetical protein
MTGHSGRLVVLTVQKRSVLCVGFEAYVCGAAPREEFVLSGPAGRKSGLSVFRRTPWPACAPPRGQGNCDDLSVFLVLITTGRLHNTLQAVDN